jgi:hypothetical protein
VFQVVASWEGADICILTKPLGCSLKQCFVVADLILVNVSLVLLEPVLEEEDLL